MQSNLKQRAQQRTQTPYLAMYPNRHLTYIHTYIDMYTQALNMRSIPASVARGVYMLGELMPDVLLMLMYANGWET